MPALAKSRGGARKEVVGFSEAADREENGRQPDPDRDVR